jgi:hypothetical protein
MNQTKTAPRSSNANSNKENPIDEAIANLQEGDLQELVDEVTKSIRNYAEKRPVVVTSLVFLAGFYLGWKIKPW